MKASPPLQAPLQAGWVPQAPAATGGLWARAARLRGARWDARRDAQRRRSVGRSVGPSVPPRLPPSQPGPARPGAAHREGRVPDAAHGVAVVAGVHGPREDLVQVHPAPSEPRGRASGRRAGRGSGRLLSLFSLPFPSFPSRPLNAPLASSLSPARGRVPGCSLARPPARPRLLAHRRAGGRGRRARVPAVRDARAPSPPPFHPEPGLRVRVRVRRGVSRTGRRRGPDAGVARAAVRGFSPPPLPSPPRGGFRAAAPGKPASGRPRALRRPTRGSLGVKPRRRPRGPAVAPRLQDAPRSGPEPVRCGSPPASARRDADRHALCTSARRRRATGADARLGTPREGRVPPQGRAGRRGRRRERRGEGSRAFKERHGTN